MIIKNYLVIGLLLSLFSTSIMASNEQEKIYLTQIINQLDALRPLILAADKEQDQNNRIKFHYFTYRDSNENPHNGLLEDVIAIKKGIQERLNQSTPEPRNFQKIKGDYFTPYNNAEGKNARK